MNHAVKIQNLFKNYGSVRALKGVDLEIASGEFFGLLGPNGAGKSTLINCIVGLVKPTEGEVTVFGNSVRKKPLAAKRYIGFSPQEVNVERFFNLRRTLEFQGGFYGLPRVKSRKRAGELLEQFGLIEKAGVQFFRLSGGMQKRLLIARAMMSQPKLLILDEPTAGIDVAQRHDLWKYLQNLNQDGTTIILTTHYIDEAEALCERVGIINHGKVLELGKPKELIEKYCRAQIRLKIQGGATEEEFHDVIGIRGSGFGVRVEGDKIVATTPSLGPTLEGLLAKIAAKPGRRVLDVNVQRGNLEDVFLQVTGRSMKEEATNSEEPRKEKLRKKQEPIVNGQ